MNLVNEYLQSNWYLIYGWFTKYFIGFIVHKTLIVLLMKALMKYLILSNCSLVTPYGISALGHLDQVGSRLIPVWHPGITWISESDLQEQILVEFTQNGMWDKLLTSFMQIYP